MFSPNTSFRGVTLSNQRRSRLMVYRCDATPEVGFGHLKRGIDLVEAVKARVPFEARFLGTFADRARAFIVGRLGEVTIPVSNEPKDDGKLRAMLGELRPDLAVVDLLERDADPGFMRIFRDTCRTTVAITDDARKRAIDADLVVNCNPTQEASWYAEPQRYRLGLRYFLADPALTAERRRTVPPIRGNRARVFVGFGGRDVGDSKRRIVDALEPLKERLHLDLLVTPFSPSMETLLAHLKATDWDAALHQSLSPPALAALIADADLAICSMGNVGYEVLLIGCPLITVNLVARQDEIATCLAASGAVINLGMVDRLEPDRLRGAVARLVDSEDERRRMSKAGQVLCDGQGLGRVADLVVDLLTRHPDAVGSAGKA